MRLPLLTLAVCMFLACSDDRDAGTSALATDPTTESVGQTPASTGTGSEATDAETTGATVTGATATGAEETGSSGEATTEPPPMPGPGVMPGETGLDAFCRRMLECGGMYVRDQQGCIDEMLAIWGSCPSRRAPLDVFGACISELACDEWDPDAYNPPGDLSPCAQEYSELSLSDVCR